MFNFASSIIKPRATAMSDAAGGSEGLEEFWVVVAVDESEKSGN